MWQALFSSCKKYKRMGKVEKRSVFPLWRNWWRQCFPKFSFLRQVGLQESRYEGNGPSDKRLAVGDTWDGCASMPRPPACLPCLFVVVCCLFVVCCLLFVVCFCLFFNDRLSLRVRDSSDDYASFPRPAAFTHWHSSGLRLGIHGQVLRCFLPAPTVQ